MWLVLPPSCPCAPASADLTLPSDKSFQRLASCALWRLKPSPARSWRTRWRKAVWMRHLSGLICEPSTAERGVAAWISSLRDSRASRFPSRENSAAASTHATSGRTSAGLLTGRDRLSSFLKTSPAYSLFDSLTDAPPSRSSDPNYNAWLIELRRSSLQRLKSARLTSVSGCSSSLWPTADANTSTYSNGERGMNLREAASHWPRSEPRRGRDRQSYAGVAKWAARLWATPTTRDWKDGSDPSDQTPTNCLLGRQAPRTMTDGPLSSLSGPTSRRRLNPRFVEWLMGFPPAWTNFAPTATPSCQPKVPTHFNCCLMLWICVATV